MRKYIYMCAAACCVAMGACSDKKGEEKPDFVGGLMAKMTLEEKIGQLNLQVAGDIVTGGAQTSSVVTEIADGRIGGVFNLKGVEKIRQLQEIAVEESRIGIPLLVGMDVIHGYETVFPIPLAMACSWDEEAVEEAARIAAKEASADGINWVFSPMVDVSLDSRWGRTAEGFGEDTYMNSVMGAAMVRGYQGNLESKESVMACVKHYALYGAAEAGREYNTVDMSRYRMRNRYFPPYKAAVDAGAGSVMTSFNLVEGVPATASKWLIEDVLRKEWGFGGLVVTDYASLNELMEHRVATDYQEASIRAMKAGTDVDMCSRGYVETLKASLNEGRVTMEEIEKACRRVLEAKVRLGLFDDPYKYCDTTRRGTDIYNAEHRRKARELATKTFVLLKNEKGLLPLKKKGTIALIGPMADARNNMAGTWSVAATHEKYKTLRESMEEALEGKARLVYAQGCNVIGDSAKQRDAEFGRYIRRVDLEKAMEEALRAAKEADVVVCAMGECAEMSGECASRADLAMPEEQMRLMVELEKTGKPIVLLNFSGRATVMKWETEHIESIMNVWYGGSETGDAVCDVLFGEKSPSGKLAVTMPRSVGQMPLYYSHLSTGRPVAEGETKFRKYASNYLDEVNDPLYPFGYGLSYTVFMYSDLRIEEGEKVRVSVRVGNVGEYDAEEVVQLYVAARNSTTARPVRELKRFKRVSVASGESVEVEFELGREDFGCYVGEEFVVEAGGYDVMVGGSSMDVMRGKVEVR